MSQRIKVVVPIHYLGSRPGHWNPPSFGKNYIFPSYAEGDGKPRYSYTFICNQQSKHNIAEPADG